jgi:hypothetical protein
MDSSDEIPAFINGYNHNMSGVNITDQHSSCNQTHHTSTDLVPLFFWALRTAPVDSYLIYKDCPQATDIQNNRFWYILYANFIWGEDEKNAKSNK